MATWAELNAAVGAKTPTIKSSGKTSGWEALNAQAKSTYVPYKAVPQFPKSNPLSGIAETVFPALSNSRGVGPNVLTGDIGSFLGGLQDVVSLPFRALIAVPQALQAGGATVGKNLAGQKTTFSEEYKKTNDLATNLANVLENPAINKGVREDPTNPSSYFGAEFFGQLAQAGVAAVGLGYLGSELATKSGTIRITPEQLSGKEPLSQPKINLLTRIFENAPPEVVDNLKTNGVKIKVTKPSGGLPQVVGEQVLGGRAPQSRLNIEIPNYTTGGGFPQANPLLSAPQTTGREVVPSVKPTSESVNGFPVANPIVDLGVGNKTSGVAKSIEAKALEQGIINKGFDTLAEFSGTTFEEQANILSKLGDSQAIAILRGEEPMPSNLRSAALISYLEDIQKKTGDAQLAYELANSNLPRRVSEAASEVSIARLREPDSATMKLQEIRKARQELSQRQTGSQTQKAAKDIVESTRRVNLSKEDLSWDKFLSEITC